MKQIFKELKLFTLPCLVIIITTTANVFADLFLPKYMSVIVNTGVLNGDVPIIIQIGLKMLLVTIIGGLCAIVGGYFASKVSAGVSKNLRSHVFRKVEEFSLQEFDTLGTSSLITRTTNDIIQIQTFLNMFLRIIVMAPIMAIGGIVMAYDINASMANVVLIAIPILTALIVVISKFSLPLSASLQKKLDTVNLVIREKLSGIRVMRAFGTEAYENKRFDIANADLTQTTIKMQRIMMSLMPALTLVLNVTTITLVSLGAKYVLGGVIIVGDIMAIIQYVMQIMMSLMMISMTFIILPRAQASAQRIAEVLATKATIVDAKTPAHISQLRGEVVFKNVTFCFPNSLDPTIENISFSAKRGETTAIIGSTGSGKSTIVNLIPRFYDVQEGDILIDGISIKEYSLHELRDKIGYIPQKSLLFSGTVAENIRFGKLDATEEEVLHAAEIAQASDFINEKEEGLSFHIAQGGANVSGGQRQRLSIARAIVKKPEIYIFDDSFSALDFKTDALLRKKLKEETTDATTIIVAQRVSTIMGADRIIVMDDGKVAAIGTHKELMKSCEIYYEIVKSQNAEKFADGLDVTEKEGN